MTWLDIWWDMRRQHRPTYPVPYDGATWMVALIEAGKLGFING